MSPVERGAGPRRRVWVAVVLALVAPGLGQLYAGRPLRALIVAILLTAAPPASGALTAASAGTPESLLLAFSFVVLFAFAAVIDAGVQARGGVALPFRRGVRVFFYLAWVLGTVAAGELIGTTAWGDFVQSYRLPTESMAPTLLRGDYFIMDKRAYREKGPRRRDVVVFRGLEDPPKSYVKRVVGIPGDRLVFRNREIYRNGVADGYAPSDQGFAPVVLGPGEYFMVGDSRSNSRDSRHDGPVRRERILGRAVTIYFSRDPDSGEFRWSRVGATIR